MKTIIIGDMRINNLKLLVMKTIIQQLFFVIFFMGFIANSQTNIWDENPNESQLELDSLLAILPKTEGREKIPILNRVAEIYWTVNPDITIEYANEALRLSKEYEDKSQEGLALINLCQGYLFNDLYDKALQFGLQSLEIRNEIGDDYDLAFTLRTLGWLYYDIGYFDKALEYHTETFKIHEKIGDKQRIAYSYNSIGLIHEKKGDCYLALDFFKNSLKLKQEFNNKDRIAETLGNMGICYRKTNDLAKAQEFLEAALDIVKEIDDRQNMVYILNELAIVNLELKHYEKSYSILEESCIIIKTLRDNKELTLENDRIRSDYYLAVGNYQESLLYYKKFTKGNTEIFSNNKSEQLADMRILYENERRESEIKLLEQQRSLEAQKKKAIFIGLILLVIIAVLIIVSLRNNIKKKKASYLQNQELSKEKLKTQSLIRENLEHKLEFRKTELTNLALFISQRTSIYKDLTKSFKSLKFNDISQIKKDINALIKEYTFKFDFNEDIKRFHNNVETLQSDFLFRIKKEYPLLTNKDIQLAVQVKLKLSSKEIANINNISLNSVEVGRHRLRKKLGLEKKDNLVDFLENI
ncbi:tetratricopeptide repeat protein [Winogradskyella bathintestinalis]|uniref:Tetratricopeptide repeat protein n=1 Tax=Winogradskyella bathintestinalis TaxID=3035208 RepID=A0ABT7ZR72_9FLAO|nr:tetratricopeptide repeat protein [Winogradskyella bathintestinalis]MDN3491511.1 tetratricopeptide repeat protein [Winogradskyella bathintestinalis]